MDFKIKIELVQALASYLETRPYREVVGLLNNLINLKKIDENDKDKIKKENN